MRRLIPFAVVAGCLGGLMVACFGPVLFRGEQFAYRDAGHYYYPLYQRVQADWDAWRLPLWEAEENGGMPLLGNPTAAVLYPGKILFAVVPYAWGARLYIIAHVLLAFAGMVAMARSGGLSWAGSGLAGIAYAFGAPILFQYCNVIYLVGAAWAPLGLRAVDRWLRQGRRWGLVELAVVLAMQTLGGDPQAAYLIGLTSAGYAAALSVGPRPVARKISPWVYVVVALAIALVWCAIAVVAANRLPSLRPPTPAGKPKSTFVWVPWLPRIAALGWAIVGLMLAYRRRRGRGRDLVVRLVGLGASAGLALLLTAGQLLPVLEFTALTGRAAEQGPHDIYPFSLEPARVAEVVWPDVFGSNFVGNTQWLSYAGILANPAKIWVPSLYLGGLTILFALGATVGGGGDRAWGRWLGAILTVSMLGSFGEYGGPLAWARLVPAWQGTIGAPDPAETQSIRMDGQLRDGDGSIYWAMATALPGFQAFRYPSKLLTFAAIAAAALAGLGWDRLVEGGPGARRVARAGAGLLVVSLLALLAVLATRSRIVAALLAASSGRGSTFGPLDAAGAHATIVAGLARGAASSALAVALALRARRSPRFASGIALMALAVDVGSVNRLTIGTAPQSVFETVPRVDRLIAEAERADPSPGPFRIHRLPSWELPGWRSARSPDRIAELVRWEHDTVQPKYGLLHSLSYAYTVGVAELYDHEWFFSPFPRTVGAQAARMLNIEPGREVVYSTRRGFDLWGARYFVLPSYPGDWANEHRAYAAFLLDTEPIYPKPGAFDGPGKVEATRRHLEWEDFQIRRNKAAYPRAWAVHDFRFARSIEGMGREARKDLFEEMLYEADPFWNEPGRPVFDPRSIAWIETADASALNPFWSRNPPEPAGAIRVVDASPVRVEIQARMDSPGLVVLADVYYPGWKLTIDGKPSTIYRANRLMRGAAVPSGTHDLVYTYEPDSARVGLRLALVGLIVLAVGAFWARRQPGRG